MQWVGLALRRKKARSGRAELACTEAVVYVGRTIAIIVNKNRMPAWNSSRPSGRNELKTILNQMEVTLADARTTASSITVKHPAIAEHSVASRSKK